MSYTHSPAHILRTALIQAGVGVATETLNPGAVPVWPLSIGHLPKTPDNAMCVYDTTGKPDGRLMGTGETIQHPGFQIRVRSNSYQAAWSKISELQGTLNALVRRSVMIDGVSYSILSVTQTGSPLSLGQDADAARRDQLTLNGTLTIKEISQ